MRRVFGMAVVMALAVLVVTAVPVSAANTAVASQHTTDSDFNSADTLENVTVSGSGTGADVVLDSEGSAEDFTTYTEEDPGNVMSIDSSSNVSFSGLDANTDGGIYKQLGQPITGDRTIQWTFKQTDHADFAHNHVTIGTQGGLNYTEMRSQSLPFVTADYGSSGSGNSMTINTSSASRTQVASISTGTEYYVTLTLDDSAGQATLEMFSDRARTNSLGSATVSYDASASYDYAYAIQGHGADFSNPGTMSGYHSNLVLDTSKVETGTYIGAAHAVDSATQGFTNISLANASAHVTWQQSTDGGATWSAVASSTYTTSGNKSLAFSGSGLWRVNVTFERTGTNPTAELHDEGVRFTNNDPSISLTNPADGAQLSSETVTLKAQVNDSDFPHTQGDTVTGEFKVKAPGDSSFSTVGTESRSSNGTMSVQYDATDGGSYSWKVDPVTDSYGGSTASGTQSFSVPSTLYVRNETDADQLVDNANVTVRFYQDGNETVVERTTTNGQVDLTGLPVGDKLVVSANADKYQRRTTIIDDIFSQNSMYLLSENVSSVEVRFTLTDNTGGEFPQESTEVLIEKPINRSGTTKFRTVAADEVGVKGFSTFLEEDVRYRITVRNNDGDTRLLGSYTATVSETVELTIGEVTYDADQSDTEDYEWDASQVGEDANSKIKFNFSDAEGATGDIRLEIWEYGNKSNNTIVNTTLNGPHGSTSYTEPLSAAQANKTWVVRWSADRNSEEIGAKRVLGGQGPLGIVLDDLWKHSIAAGSIFVFAGLFGGLRKELGVIVVPVLAGIWWYIGWLPTAVGAGAIMLALTIGVLVNVRSRGGP